MNRKDAYVLGFVIGAFGASLIQLVLAKCGFPLYVVAAAVLIGIYVLVSLIVDRVDQG